MRYLLMLYGDEQQWAAMPSEAQQEAFGAFMHYNKVLKEAGVVVSGESLQPSITATCIRMDNGVLQSTDGPFAETKEQLGGYYLLDVPSLDDAIEWAAKCPAVYGGTIELRPLANVGVS
jgi:hypothetical protein